MIETIIWWLFLLDSAGANIMVWFFPKWYKQNLGWIAKHVPASKAWALLYLVLVLWVGSALWRLGVV